MAPTYSHPSKLGTLAPDFELRGTDGRTYRLADFRDSKALVLTFMCNHCPYVIAVQSRINQLAKEYQTKGIQLVGINSNDSVLYPEDDFGKMKLRAQEQGYVFPYLHDETQEVAKAYGAVCTPEFYVYVPNAQGKFALRYQGRLDDNWKEESAVTRRELALALDEILEGRDPDLDQKPAMGCSIKWR